MTVLRALWTEELVAFNGQWHHIPDAGINPRPVQQPIPLWVGGDADIVLRRAARTGDGWLARSRSPTEVRTKLEWLREFLSEEGRDPETFSIHVRMNAGEVAPDEWVNRLCEWASLGATHAAFEPWTWVSTT